MPGELPNSVNLDDQGVIPVAILATDFFDATSVRVETVKFAGAPAVHSAMEDVDADGDFDLLLHFRTAETSISPGDVVACLQGETVNGDGFEGCDSMRTISHSGDSSVSLPFLALIPIALLLPSTLSWFWIRIRAR